MQIERYLWSSRKILKALGTNLTERLKQSGISVSKPYGAFYLFPDFCSFQGKLKNRNIDTSTKLCDSLLAEANAAILPGKTFGRPKVN